MYLKQVLYWAVESSVKTKTETWILLERLDAGREARPITLIDYLVNNELVVLLHASIPWKKTMETIYVLISRGI